MTSKTFLYLLLSLLIGFCSTVGHTQRYAGDRSSYDNKTPAVFETDQIYNEECGACDMAYPPGLLPAKSWQRLLNSHPKPTYTE